jgi:UDP-4-amino-4-deoxy-L-arabinose-oxoglutarate aminotransferase
VPTTEVLMQKAFLLLSMPDADDTEVAEVTSVIRSGWLTPGAKATRFESEFVARVATGCGRG